jgi:glycosyltransferase involved in cell wall biosynthesis
MEPIKVIQVATGTISIPPNGWGAIERIVWAYKQKLENIGDVVDIQYVNQVTKQPNTIVHAHIANLALECRDKGIPYVFSLHDHHTEHYGKDSHCYKHNVEAIKGSIISFTHAEHLVEYFDTVDKLFYLSHGADTEFFVPNYLPVKVDDRTGAAVFSLLMIANNGLAGNPGIDRKGFRYGIEAAKELGLPITIAGHPDNQKFFDIHSELLNYDKLTLKLTNPTDEETRELYQSHAIFLHPSFLEAGHPNLTLMEAASSCIPIVGTYKGSKHIHGMWVIPECTTDNVIHGINKTIKTYDHRRNEMFKMRESLDWQYVANTLHKFYENVLKVNDKYNSERTKQSYINAFNNA